MALLRYVGPHDEVYVPAARVTAQRDGDPVAVDDEAVAASLLDQETWVKATHAPAKKATTGDAPKEA